jgi:hypothetical protein
MGIGHASPAIHPVDAPPAAVRRVLFWLMLRLRAIDVFSRDARPFIM